MFFKKRKKFCVKEWCKKDGNFVRIEEYLQLPIYYLRSEGFNRKLICKAKSKAQRLPAWRQGRRGMEERKSELWKAKKFLERERWTSGESERLCSFRVFLCSWIATSFRSTNWCSRSRIGELASAVDKFQFFERSSSDPGNWTDWRTNSSRCRTSFGVGGRAWPWQRRREVWGEISDKIWAEKLSRWRGTKWRRLRSEGRTSPI